ncbi:hypothetical protein FQR65_LT20539 [Abscondita terminalis]|nr:hypothetical protein FQR65_LT20539 [Abscondita terminalis]
MSTSRASLPISANGETAQNCNCVSEVDATTHTTPVPMGITASCWGAMRWAVPDRRNFYQKRINARSPHAVWVKRTQRISSTSVAMCIIGSATLYTLTARYWKHSSTKYRSGKAEAAKVFIKAGNAQAKYVEDNTGARLNTGNQCAAKPAANEAASATSCNELAPGRLMMPAMLPQLTAAIAELTKEIRQYAPFNMMLSMVLRCSRKIARPKSAYIVRQHPFPEATLCDEDVKREFSEVTTPNDRVAIYRDRTADHE